MALGETMTKEKTMSIDKSARTARLLCGLSTALMIICNLIVPVCLVLWFDAATPRQQDTYALDALVISLLCCGAGMIAALFMAIVAKLKEPASKWAVVNIVILSILLVLGILGVFFTIWAASQYHYYG